MCKHCRNDKEYKKRADLRNLPFQMFFAKIMVGGSAEYLYNYEGVGTPHPSDTVISC